MPDRAKKIYATFTKIIKEEKRVVTVTVPDMNKVSKKYNCRTFLCQFLKDKMMKTKRFCWILLLNLLVLTAGAEPYETVVLKNGSVLEGYISVQHPGKDIIFFAEKATVYIR